MPSSRKKTVLGITNLPPKGYFESADCTEFKGWACDLDDHRNPIEVEFYEGTNLIGTATADKVKPLSIGQQCGGNRFHGFVFTTPASLKNGIQRDIKAFAVNTPAGTDVELTDSPKSITCGTPRGYTPIIPTTGNNVFALGTCDDNSVIASKLGTSGCNDLTEGDALIKFIRETNKVYLIIAGATEADAKTAFKEVFNKLDKWDAQGNKINIVYNDQVMSVGFTAAGQKKYSMEYTLREGKNFLGSPYTLPDEDIKDVFAPIISKIDGIFKYDANLERKEKWWVWRKIPVPYDLKKFGKPLEAYRIDMKDDAVLMFKNLRERSAERETIDDEYIAYTPLKKGKLSEIFEDAAITSITDIRCWKNGRYEQLSKTDDPVLDIGMGCMIKFSEGGLEIS